MEILNILIVPLSSLYIRCSLNRNFTQTLSFTVVFLFKKKILKLHDLIVEVKQKFFYIYAWIESLPGHLSIYKKKNKKKRSSWFLLFNKAYSISELTSRTLKKTFSILLQKNGSLLSFYIFRLVKMWYVANAIGCLINTFYCLVGFKLVLEEY